MFFKSNTIIYISYISINIMSASHKFELALHFKTLRNIGVRQTSYLQIRTLVFHKSDKK